MTKDEKIEIKKYLEGNEWPKISIEEIDALKNDDFALFLKKYSSMYIDLFSKLFLQLRYRAEDLIRNANISRK